MKTIEERIDEYIDTGDGWPTDLLREAAEELRRLRGLIREHNASFSCVNRGCTCALEDER